MKRRWQEEGENDAAASVESGDGQGRGSAAAKLTAGDAGGFLPTTSWPHRPSSASGHSRGVVELVKAEVKTCLDF